MNIISYALKILLPKAKAFEEASKDPLKAQRKVLFEFLARNQKTEYGLKYNFSKIKSILYNLHHSTNSFFMSIFR